MASKMYFIRSAGGVMHLANTSRHPFLVKRLCWLDQKTAASGTAPIVACVVLKYYRLDGSGFVLCLHCYFILKYAFLIS